MENVKAIDNHVKLDIKNESLAPSGFDSIATHIDLGRVYTPTHTHTHTTFFFRLFIFPVLSSRLALRVHSLLSFIISFFQCLFLFYLAIGRGSRKWGGKRETWWEQPR